ncbi:aldo/keto reductase [Gillisia sp. M10.2A]|uniref:Aldo/keto reductase n=1 Tax=Gillisia lutea TaxID=2909668 RepID=A0ABS9EJB9_9FLAO|nr:aldo/keto reductase [Gillisia lutea]MCF4101910.1 aldo/keto reductase [Gillisia lutea]
MKKRRLGNNGFEISEIGLGCWQIGGDWGAEIGNEKSQEILSKAVDSGITFFDTADVYGNGRSEEQIGRFLKEHNEEVKVATKFGRDANIFPDNYTEKGLRDCVAASKKRLGVSCIDLLQLHCIPIDVLRKGEVFNWLRALKKEGEISHFGVSVESEEEGLLCLKEEGIQSLQVIFNIFRQKLATQLLPQAKVQGVGIIVRLPLASGLLTGKFTKETQFSEDDHRNFNSNGEVFNVGETFAGLPFEKGVELANELKKLCPSNMSLAEMSLRWILDHEEVTTIIPGASSSKHIQANSKVSSLPPLPDQLTAEIAHFYKEHVHDHIRGVY